MDPSSAGPDEVVHRVVSAVRPRLRDQVDSRVLEDTARRVVIELSEGARVVDFVPVLAEHRVREELRSVPARLSVRLV